MIDTRSRANKEFINPEIIHITIEALKSAPIEKTHA